MRKAAIVFSALFWLIIIFFTFFGSTLYDITKPSVYAEFPTEMNGRLYLPKSAIFEENGGFYVYALSARPAFHGKSTRSRGMPFRTYSRTTLDIFRDM